MYLSILLSLYRHLFYKFFHISRSHYGKKKEKLVTQTNTGKALAFLFKVYRLQLNKLVLLINKETTNNTV